MTTVPTVRQILLITDGCSNVGEDPVDVATLARSQSIAVNVVGVVDKGEMGKRGQEEAASIADAGGGLCRIVRPTELSATAQMLTHQTMQSALRQVVSDELAQLMGKSTAELPPPRRAAVMQVVDKLEEEVRLQVVVAIDTSASMKEKMATVREAVRDLTLSLQARLGDSAVAVITFPGDGDQLTRIVQPFAQAVDMPALETVFSARGGTPTGPALRQALQMFQRAASAVRDDDDSPAPWLHCADSV